MGVHLCELVKRLSGQRTYTVADMGFMLSHYGHTRLSEQFIVMKQRTGYGILYGHNTYDRRVLLHILKHLLKGGTTDNLQLVTLEAVSRRYIVETT